MSAVFGILHAYRWIARCKRSLERYFRIAVPASASFLAAFAALFAFYSFAVSSGSCITAGMLAT